MIKWWQHQPSEFSQRFRTGFQRADGKHNSLSGKSFTQAVDGVTGQQPTAVYAAGEIVRIKQVHGGEIYFHPSGVISYFAHARKRLRPDSDRLWPRWGKGAAQAAYFGQKVALIEKEPELGGAAANTGTLPFKTLCETALYLSGFRQRGLYGIHLTVKDQVTARDFLYRERVVAEAERDRVSGNPDHHKVDQVPGKAEFMDAHTIKVSSRDGETSVMTGKAMLAATGSSPYCPPNSPFDHPRVFDSDTILQIEELPDSMLVAGGGVIGCE